MSTPTLRALVAEAEQLLEEQAQQRTFAQWQADCAALFAEAGGDSSRASVAYQRLLQIPAPDPATAPTRPQGYREQTPEEVYIEMITGYRAGLDEAVDREIDAFRTHDTLPESIAGLEALAKLLGMVP